MGEIGLFKSLLYAMHLYKVRWDSQFPDAKPGDEPIPDIRREAEKGPCEICHRATSWRNTVTDT
jgi:hypothetical protein